MLNTLLQRMNGFFLRRSRRTILALSLVGVVVLSAVAYFASALNVRFQGVISQTLLPTPGDLLLLYLVPIFFASWYAGWPSGLTVAVWAGVATFVAETISAGVNEFQPHLLIALAVRTAAFLVIARVMARLHDARRQKEELTRFIVHDLRSPLASSITGLLTLQQTAEELKEDERELVDLALVSNNRALGLVNSILDVAKLEGGKMPVEFMEVEIAPFVEECFQQVELWARGQDTDLQTDLQIQKGRFDPILTGRVLVNLLSNALKVSPEGSRLMLRAVLNHGALRFSVSDEGRGIPAEEVELVFQPFGQIKGTQGGTGLGLTFCRLAVQAQGGKIWVESHVGKGTTFLFTIPQQTAPTRASGPSQAGDAS